MSARPTEARAIAELAKGVAKLRDRMHELAQPMSRAGASVLVTAAGSLAVTAKMLEVGSVLVRRAHAIGAQDILGLPDFEELLRPHIEPPEPKQARKRRARKS